MIELDVALKVGTFNLEMAFRNDDGITALFGHSGSGKSLTLNLIAGLMRPDRGTITLHGRVLVDRARGTPSRERAISFDVVAEILGIGKLLPRYPANPS